MSFVGHGWRSGQSGDYTGSASSATVTSITAPTSRARRSVAQLLLNGTGFVSGAVIIADNNPVATTFVSATQLRCDSFVVNPDNGSATSMVLKARNPSQQLTGTSATLTVTG